MIVPRRMFGNIFFRVSQNRLKIDTSYTRRNTRRMNQCSHASSKKHYKSGRNLFRVEVARVEFPRDFFVLGIPMTSAIGLEAYSAWALLDKIHHNLSIYIIAVLKTCTRGKDTSDNISPNPSAPQVGCSCLIILSLHQVNTYEASIHSPAVWHSCGPIACAVPAPSRCVPSFCVVQSVRPHNVHAARKDDESGAQMSLGINNGIVAGISKGNDN